MPVGSSPGFESRFEHRRLAIFVAVAVTVIVAVVTIVVVVVVVVVVVSSIVKDGYVALT